MGLVVALLYPTFGPRPHQPSLQLLQKQGLSLAWKPTLLRLAYEVQSQIRPNVAAGDHHDVRAYVKIRCLAGGSMDECCYHRGVMFTKNVADKRMPTRIEHPRILVLRFPLEYAPRGVSKYASLEPVLAQEQVRWEAFALATSVMHGSLPDTGALTLGVC